MGAYESIRDGERWPRTYFMRRRNVIIGAASGIGGITIIGSGAFDTATAERTATVNFADDEDAYLGLVSESDYAIDDGGELALDFTGVSTDGEGIGRNSEYFFDLVFSIANQATNPISITITTDTESFDGEFGLYPTGDRDEKLNDGSNAIELAVGESQSIGTHLKTGDVDVTNDVDIDIEIAGEFDEEEGDEPEEPEPDPFDELQFRSGASQIAADGESQLTDQSVIAAWAPLGSENIDQSDSDPVEYSSDDEIPVVSVDIDSSVAGLGTPELIEDEEANFSAGNEEFVLNLFDEIIDGGTVLWDEGHDGFWTITDDEDNSFDDFVDYAESNGYSVDPTTDVESDLDDADGIVIASPSDAYTDDEIDALSDFSDDGGGILLFDESDFTVFGSVPDGVDETENLNEIADGLDLGFRFNSDQVEDPDENFDFVTSEFNLDEFSGLFEDREGIE